MNLEKLMIISLVLGLSRYSEHPEIEIVTVRSSFNTDMLDLDQL